MTDLASIIAAHGLTFITDIEHGDGFICLCEVGDLNPAMMTQDEWAEHVAGMVREARTIRTVEELRDLESVDGLYIYSEDTESMYMFTGSWRLVDGSYVGDVPLPALVLFHPEWDGSDD